MQCWAIRVQRARPCPLSPFFNGERARVRGGNCANVGVCGRPSPRPSPRKRGEGERRSAAKPCPPTSTPANVEALEAQAQRLMGTFARAGYERIAPAVIQPAGLFLDVVGRGTARAHLCLHRSRRRGAVPASRPHGADLPPAPGAPPARRYAGALLLRGSAFRYQPGGADRRTRASSARPASSCLRARRPRAGRCGRVCAHRRGAARRGP